MQNWLRGTRIALLISLFLHIALFAVLKGESVYGGIHNITKWLPIDIVNVPPDSSMLPNMFDKKIEASEKKWTPVKRETKFDKDVSSFKLSNERLPARQVITTKMESISRLNVPIMKPEISQESFLTSSMPNASQTGFDSGLASQGKDFGRNYGSSESGLKNRSITDSGKIISSPQRNISVTRPSVSEKLQVYKDSEMPFVNGLKAFGNNIVKTKTSKKVDVAFILDISESMQDNIDSIRRHIYRLIESLKEDNLDYTVGLVTFHYNQLFDWLKTDIEITGQTDNIEEIRDALQGVKVSGGERQLDALMKSFSKVRFRSGASRHFIFVTDEYVKGTYSISDVLREAKRSKVIVDVLGRDEPFQRSIAEQTGGIWMPIEVADMN